MRPIKFRAWDSEEQQFVSGKYLLSGVRQSTIDVVGVAANEGDEMLIEDGIILMQYTGLKDTNGVEIYEGDQLFAPGNLTDELEYVGDVVWDEEDARWETANFHGRFEYIPNGEVVVKGNIYENPKLSKEAI